MKEGCRKRSSIRSTAIGKIAACAAAAALVLLGGCENREETAGAQPKGVIRIAYGSEEQFQYAYADYFAAKFPQLEVQIVPTEDIYGAGKDPVKEYMKIIDEQKPDLLFTNTFDYGKLAAEGKLYDLSPLIAKDRFDLDNLLPASLDFLRIKGQGKLYGLAPSFSSSVLFYNKDLFDKHHVPYPTDHMTWEDLIRLAQRFPSEGGKEDRVYGFHMGYMKSPMDLINYIGQAEGLAIVDSTGKKLMADTDAWKRTYRLVIDGYKTGLFQWTYAPDKQRYEKEDVEREDVFSTGRAAMTINNIGQFNGLKQRGASFTWDMTNVPSDAPGRSGNPNFYLYPIYSINARAENVLNAWEVVKYFNGAEAAKIEAKTSVELPVRKAFAREVDGHSLDAFYRVTYDETVQSGYNEAIPRSFAEAFDKASQDIMQEMLKGGLPVEEGLKRLQEQGQQALDAAHVAEQVKGEKKQP
ncbi:extracellular solute-binding protein [Paenibacillus sp. H1-7]|uniref:ABC transporter substrate-binding protein n=1 Tax=Paenibacillus sp. H1-7 TaxID=2282849 RepID=UPI001EF85738|nr:extracellular solute-binding protein [Paenibacillus sp. H1-7]